MFHRRCNELRLLLHLKPAAPLLIKAGEDPLDILEKLAGDAGGSTAFGQLVNQEKAKIRRAKEEEKKRREDLKQQRQDGRKERDKLDLDMKFVRTLRNGQDEPYLPGSSLKGVLRTRCEQLASTFYASDRICNIHDQEGKSSGLQSCTKRVEAIRSSERYAAACPICKMFGCGGLAGRLAVSDGYLLQGGQHGTGVRDGVGISRQRGASETGALFAYEVLETGTFTMTLTLENFEIWQVGMIAYALNDLLTGGLAVGYGSRRGLGTMSGEVIDASLSYFGLNNQGTATGCRLLGVAGLMDGVGYGFVGEPPSVEMSGAQLERRGLRQMWRLPAGAVEQMWQVGAVAWLNELDVNGGTQS